MTEEIGLTDTPSQTTMTPTTDGGWGSSAPGFEAAVVVLAVVGVMGNGIVLLVLLKVKKCMMANMFIINQAAIDGFAGIWIIIDYSYKLSPGLGMTGSGAFAICLLLDGELFLWCGLNASVYGLLAITVERYLKVVHPIMHRNKFGFCQVVAMVICSWMWPFAWIIGFTVPFSSVEDGVCYIQASWPSKTLQNVYGILKLLLFFILPVVILIAAYAHMLYIIHTRASVTIQPQPEQNDGPESGPAKVKKVLSRAQMNLTRVMVMITLCFIVCWVPSNIYYLLFNLGLNSLGFGHPLYYTFLFLVFVNSCINPIIYVWKLEVFRSALVSVMPCLSTKVSAENITSRKTATLDKNNTSSDQVDIANSQM